MGRLAILGCGWLGTAVGRWALTQGWCVVANARREAHWTHLQSLGIETVRLSLPLVNDVPEAFYGDALLIALPLRAETPIDDILRITEHFIAKGGRRVVMISSTSVYGDAKGVVTEVSALQPLTTSAKRNVALEQALLTAFPAQVKVLRLSGLIGEDRHPITSLSGRELSGGGRPVNLIHQDDAVAAIWALLQGKGEIPIYHLATLAHPSRHDYYVAQASKRHLPLPIFVDNEGAEDKQIDATFTLMHLGLSLRHDL